ncbi:MAG: hypothetical protein J6R25_03695 [Bacteroidales bacterium]|nr:hypothetical protein [Bacteroidales bacterium]
MRSIFSTFKGLHKNGAPLDLLATWRKTFDTASEREVNLFQKMYCDEWCTYNTPQMSLTAEAIVGKYNVRFMATLIGDESPTPLRRSDGFDVWTKEIPRVGHKFPMMARDYRKLMEVYENPRLTEEQKVKQIEKTLKADMQDAYLGCKDVMDFILLMAMSNNGVAQFKPAINNPGGREYEVDYQMPEANKLVAAKVWENKNINVDDENALNPILVLSLICSDLRARGIEPGEILMDQKLYMWLRTNAQTRLLVHGKDKNAKTVTKSQFEDLLSEHEIPAITVIRRRMATNPDGKRAIVEPWNGNYIAIKPAGKIAEIQPAIEDSELMEEENVDYMNAGNGIRIAKWRTGESTGQVAAEYTQGSGRLLPLITEIGAIVCFQVRGFEEKEVTADNGYLTKAEFEANEALATV